MCNRNKRLQLTLMTCFRPGLQTLEISKYKRLLARLKEDSLSNLGFQIGNKQTIVLTIMCYHMTIWKPLSQRKLMIGIRQDKMTKI